VVESQILLIDDLGAQIDEPEARTTLARLRESVRTGGKTVVLATRHVCLASEFCDRIIFLDRGRLAFDGSTGDLRTLRSSDVYRITVGGHLDEAWSDWFGGMRIVPSVFGPTVLVGPIVDQSALHGVLTKVRDLGLPLLALSRVEPAAGDVLVQLVGPGATTDAPSRPRKPGQPG
jgi:energy-coupling factor transporter ATP-binding protein EcfA2